MMCNGGFGKVGGFTGLPLKTKAVPKPRPLERDELLEQALAEFSPEPLCQLAAAKPPPPSPQSGAKSKAGAVTPVVIQQPAFMRFRELQAAARRGDQPQGARGENRAR
jgi:hypothetical protein